MARELIDLRNERNNGFLDWEKGEEEGVPFMGTNRPRKKFS